MDDTRQRDYATLLEEAGRFHGDLCRGIRIGTRMTMAGLRAIGIRDPKGGDRKDLIVFVEIDRCATDAIMALTGCRPGKRTMKVLDYGKMAATFVNVRTNAAVRVAVREDGPDKDLAPEVFADLPDEALFHVRPVAVSLRPEDLPGPPVRCRRCTRCGEGILDGREIEAGRETLCRSCFEGAGYYRPLP